MKIVVLSHYLFDEMMKDLSLNNDNVNKYNAAFISIIGTQECLKYYLDEEDTKHYFNDSSNVLNLDFDDISIDVMYNGHHFKAMRMEQSEKTVDFIEDNIRNDIDTMYIHCRAGFSRSRAVAEFICRYCEENDINFSYEDRYGFTTLLNSDVLRKLNHSYCKKHKFNEYKINGTDYPEEFINIPIKTINTDKNGNVI